MRKQVWLGFGVYCLVAGSTWLAVAYLAPTWPDLLRLCFHDGLLCVLFGVACFLRRETLPWQLLGEAGAWCGVLFAGAPLVSAGAGGSVSGLTQVLIFAIVPVMTVFVMGQREADGEGMRMLVPVLAGMGGLALLLPFEWPNTGVGWGWFLGLLGCAALIAVAGIRLKSLLEGRALMPVAAAGCAVAAVLAGLGWRVFEAGPVEMRVGQGLVEVGWAVVVDGTLVLLMLWLVRKMSPVEFSVRFLMVPWVTLVGGLIVTREPVGWTSLAGLVLAGGAGGYVLLGSREA